MTTHISVDVTSPSSGREVDRRFLEPEIETAPREVIPELQEKRILELVPYLWERSAFYRELWSAPA